MSAKSTQVPLDVQYKPQWLTWVASATGCLKALGVECDAVDVAGYSGYAFRLTIHKELCPSGPTVFDWGSLSQGGQLLGRATQSYMAWGPNPNDPTDSANLPSASHMFDFVSGEINAGRPCVIWGNYAPEFGIAVGVDDSSYILKTFKESLQEEQPPIPYDKLDNVGVHYALAFPQEMAVDRNQSMESAVHLALNAMEAPPQYPHYSTGLDAYDTWIRSLECNKLLAFGNAYNAQCWHEARCFAADFVARLAKELDPVNVELDQAAEHFSFSRDHLKHLADMFDFPGGKAVEDGANRKQAAEWLAKAKKGDAKAMDSLRRACLGIASHEGTSAEASV